MMRWFLFLLTFSFSVVAKPDQPFWRTNPAVFKRITDERACVVAAHRDDLPDGTMAYHAHGGVLINAPRDTAFRITQDYPHLKDVSDYFREVDWHPETHMLHIVIEALGYKGDMDIHVTAQSGDPSKGDRDVINFDIPEGDFKGLYGLMSFEDYSFGKTLSALEINFKTKNPPLPKLFMSVAMEVVTQKVGERLRHSIETEPERLKKEEQNVKKP